MDEWHVHCLPTVYTTWDAWMLDSLMRCRRTVRALWNANVRSCSSCTGASDDDVWCLGAHYVSLHLEDIAAYSPYVAGGWCNATWRHGDRNSMKKMKKTLERSYKYQLSLIVRRDRIVMFNCRSRVQEIFVIGDRRVLRDLKVFNEGQNPLHILNFWVLF